MSSSNPTEKFGREASEEKPNFGRNPATGSSTERRHASSPQYSEFASMPQYSNSNPAASSPLTSPHAASLESEMIIPSHQLFTEQHHQQRHASNGFFPTTASPQTRWTGDRTTTGLPHAAMHTNMNGDATWPWSSNAGGVSHSPSPSSTSASLLDLLVPASAGLMKDVGSVHTPRSHAGVQQRFGDVSPRKMDGRRPMVDMQRYSTRYGRNTDLDPDHLEYNILTRERLIPQIPQYYSPQVDFSSGAYTSPSANSGAAHQMQANGSLYASAPCARPQSSRMPDTNLLSNSTTVASNSNLTNRPVSGRGGAMLPSTPTAAVSPTIYQFSPHHDINKKWQNLNIILPLYVPHGTVVKKPCGYVNTYVFPDSMPGAQLLFSSVGKVCDTWASYLRLRLAVIQRCPDVLVPRVVALFNSVLRGIQFDDGPILLRCTGIGKHTISNPSTNQRNNPVGVTYRYDTIGHPCGKADVAKIAVIFQRLLEMQRIVNGEFKDEMRRWAAPDSKELTGPNFNFSPCKEFKIAVREGLECCADIDNLIVSGSQSSWAQQFTVDEVGVAEIRVERDKRTDMQTDPFFQHALRTRTMSCTAEPTEGRFVLAQSVQPPPVHCMPFESAYEAGRAIYGCTYEALTTRLQSGRPNLPALATAAPAAPQNHYYAPPAGSTLSRTFPPAYAPAAPNYSYQRIISQQCPPISSFLLRESPPHLPVAMPPLSSPALPMSPAACPHSSPILGGVVSQFSPRPVPGVATPVAFQPQTPHSGADPVASPLNSNGFYYSDLCAAPYNPSSVRSPVNSVESSRPLDSAVGQELLNGFSLGSGGILLDSASELLGSHPAALQGYTAQHMMHSQQPATSVNLLTGVPHSLARSLDGRYVSSVQSGLPQYRDVVSTTASGGDALEFDAAQTASHSSDAFDNDLMKLVHLLTQPDMASDADAAEYKGDPQWPS